MRGWPILTFALLGVPLAAQGKPPRVVIVPFEAQGLREERDAALAALMPGLAIRGYEVVGGDLVERYLEDRRIRYLDSLTQEQVHELAAELQADAVLTGKLLNDSSPRAPAVGLGARMVNADGRLLWSGAASATWTPDPLRPGAPPATPRQLARGATERLLTSLPEPGRAAVQARPLHTWDGPRSFSAKGLTAKVNRVCLLPLQNFSDGRAVPRVLEALLSKGLSQVHEFQVVEPAELRRAFLQEGIWGPALLGREQLRKLSARVGGCLFLQGDILVYDDLADENGELTPVVELHVHLSDPASGKLVWSALHRRSGREYEKLLQLGALRSRFEVADHVVSELVRALY